MFFNADKQEHGKGITQVRWNEEVEHRVNQLFKDHGQLVAQFHNTMLHNVHKFQTDAEIFDDLLRETSAGQAFLEPADD
jgi:cysteine synthase